MPITQPRMLSLLGAAQDYQQTMDKLFELVQETRARVESGEITLEQGFNLLAVQIRPELLLQFPYQSPVVIQQEIAHFKREARRNARKAQKLRENRQAARLGLPRPERGDGREHGWKGGRSGGRGQFGLGAVPVPSQVQSPVTGFLQSTDHLQPGLESELELDQPDPDSLDYTPAQSEEDLLARLDPEARARIEAELGLSK